MALLAKQERINEEIAEAVVARANNIAHGYELLGKDPMQPLNRATILELACMNRSARRKHDRTLVRQSGKRKAGIHEYLTKKLREKPRPKRVSDEDRQRDSV